MAEIVNEEKEEMLERVEQRATSYMYEYKGCSQAVLLALQQEFKLLGGSSALKAASFAGKGVARMGDICGALFGGIMALGLASGRENLEDPIYPDPKVIDQASGLPKSLVVVRGFYQSFVQAFGGSTCRDIQVKMFGRSYDLGNPKENEEFSKLSNLRCSELVGQAARLAAETILEMPRR